MTLNFKQKNATSVERSLFKASFSWGIKAKAIKILFPDKSSCRQMWSLFPIQLYSLYLYEITRFFVIPPNPDWDLMTRIPLWTSNSDSQNELKYSRRIKLEENKLIQRINAHPRSKFYMLLRSPLWDDRFLNEQDVVCLDGNNKKIGTEVMCIDLSTRYCTYFDVVWQ